MKKFIRILISVILFLPSFPFLSVSISVLGMITIIGISYSLLYPLFWLGNNEEGMDDAKEGFILGSSFIWYPFIFWYEYIKTGKFEI